MFLILTILLLSPGVSPTDPLNFRDSKRYRDRLKSYQQAVGERDAVVVVQGTVEEIPVVIASMEYRFMGGSMGSVVGERFVRGVNLCLQQRIPLVSFSASGGARMQESLLSLFQMAKTSAALARLKEKGLLYISFLTDPTTGGVSASFAMLGDIILAEPRAIIGFAGARVIEQTIKQKLPDGFQRSEYLLEHGMVDRIVDRKEMKALLGQILALLGKQN